MATQKLQASRALSLIPSNNAFIPNASLIIQSINNTAVIPFGILCTTANFQTLNVSVGDVIYNITDSLAATVVTVQSQSSLTLNADIFTATGKTFAIYQASSQTGISNQGCVLYVGTGGNLSVVTSGNDTITFKAVLDGTFFPVNVTKVFSTGTTASDIIALW